MHKQFSSIESFRHIVARERSRAEFHGISPRSCTFHGTVKLHGTNGGVIVDNGEVTAASRTQILSPEVDNYGFCKFVLEQKALFRTLASQIAEHPITLFGEWCGKGIAKGCGVQTLDKHFVIFSAFDNLSEKYITLPNLASKELQEAGIHFISEIPHFEITVDFADPTAAAAKLEKLTLSVEESCPWTTYRSGVVNTVGEGIVWHMSTDPSDSSWWFKTKGLKHQKSGKPKIAADPERVKATRELAELLTPEWRLEQATEWMKEQGHLIDRSTTGHFIRWIHDDVLKEESDRIAANCYTEKEVLAAVSEIARAYYFKAVDEFAFSRTAGNKS